MKSILALIASTLGISVEQCKVCINCCGGQTDGVQGITDPTQDPATAFAVNAGVTPFLSSEIKPGDKFVVWGRNEFSSAGFSWNYDLTDCGDRITLTKVVERPLPDQEPMPGAPGGWTYFFFEVTDGFFFKGSC